MFCVSNEAATAIREAYLDKGEWPAVAELRRFYRIDDNAAALTCARTIASWAPIDTAAVKALRKGWTRGRNAQSPVI
ncbi:MAG: hypothetical protein WCJ64_12090 [Rhodospirillaceae bacterium]